MSKLILVCYASGSGSTREVAEAIGEELSEAAFTVHVRHVKEITNLTPYSAVVLGSSIRLGRWLPDAVSFLEQNREWLALVPVAYFTTCMTMANDTADSRRTVQAYLEPVRQLAPSIDPVGLGLFAGSLSPNMQRIMPGSGGPYGDYRDWAAIRGWAREIRPALLAGDAPAAGEVLLSEAVLSYGDLTEADLTRAEMSQTDLRGASLGWADLSGSNLREANLRDANLMGAKLKNADLSRADLSRAVMNGADLSQAKLSEANLSHADLNWADLRGADLRGADLHESNLGWADLTGSDVVQANFRKARYNDQTRWPEGFSAEVAECIFVSGSV